MSANSLSIVRGVTVRKILRAEMGACMQIVSDAYLAHDEHRAITPQSMFLRFPDRPNARIIGLASHLSGPDAVSGMKWIASYPDNHALQLPRASALIVLNDAQTGFAFACLEGAAISAARTAASAALAASYCLPHGVDAVESLGVVGGGFIARNVCEFLAARGCRPRSIHLNDTSAAAQGAFADWAACLWPDCTVQPEDSAGQVIARSQLTLFATLATTPHLFDVRPLEHRPVVLHLSLRDLGPEMILAASNVVDDASHILTAGTSVLLAANQSRRTDVVTCTLADLIQRRHVLDRSKPVIFSPFGLGVLDVALARWVYRRAIDRGEAQLIENFAGEAGAEGRPEVSFSNRTSH